MSGQAAVSFRWLACAPPGRGRVASRALPSEVQALLLQCIESYEQLETLLLLRARPSRPCSAHSIASELKISELMVEDACRFLCQRNVLGVLTGTGQRLFQYAPANPELDGAVSKLAAAYREQPLDIIRTMTANAFARLRMKSRGVFTNAFLRSKTRAKRP